MMGDLVPIRRVTSEVGELSDEALLAACGTGDRAALGALFDRFHVAVHRFVARLQNVDELSRDDLVQGTFLELPRTAGHFQGRSSVKSWILGVAANLARHQRRGDQRRRMNQERYASAPGPGPDLPGVELDRHRLMQRVSDALATLSHDQRVVFVLCDLEQVSGVEVARVLDVPEGTVWRRLHMARKALRAVLAKEST